MPGAAASVGQSISGADVTIYNNSGNGRAHDFGNAAPLAVAFGRGTAGAADAVIAASGEHPIPAYGSIAAGRSDIAESVTGQSLGGRMAPIVAAPRQANWVTTMIGFGLVGFFGRGRRRQDVRGGRFGTLRFRPQGVAKTAVS